MRAHETQRWLLYALICPLALTEMGWNVLRLVVTCMPSLSFLTLTLVSAELRHDLSSIDQPVGTRFSTPGQQGSGAGWVLSTAVPVCLVMGWDTALLVWLFVLLVTPRNSGTRSIRSELPTLFAFILLGAVILVWLLIGEVVYSTTQGVGYVPTHALVSYLLTAAVIASLLATYLWERIYAMRHFARAEWGSSLATLDAFDSSTEGDWARDDEGIVVRAAGMGTLDDPPLTPFTESPVTVGWKGYDAPPADPLPVSADGEQLSTVRLSSDSWTSPVSGRRSLELAMAERREQLLREAEERFEREMRAILAVTAVEGEDSGQEERYLREKRAILDLGGDGDRLQSARDEYTSEKRRILSGDFGLQRTRSA